MYYFIRFGFPVKSESGYNIAGIKVPWFAKGQDYLVGFITAISQCQAALPENKQTTKTLPRKQWCLQVVVSVSVFYLRNPEGRTFAYGLLGLQMSHLKHREMATCSKHTQHIISELRRAL